MYQEIKLTSKRNQVYRVTEDGNSYIKKIFTNEVDFYKEIDMLTILKNNFVSVPEILDIKDNSLFLEDLGCETLLDWYERLEKENSTDYEDIIIKLSQWIKKFHRASKSYFYQQYIISDVNFRNFIIKDNEVYGIDFEQSAVGKVEVDAGKIAAYALTYDPAMTEWKINFIRALINILSKELNIEKKLIVEEKEKELKNICVRRKS